MAFTYQVVIDSADPHALADWWAEAVGWDLEPSNEAFIRQMVAAGHAAEADTKTHNGVLVWAVGQAIVHPGGKDAGPGSRILFQAVPEPKTVKNRVHLDIKVGEGNLESELARLTAAGATELHRGQQGPSHWVTIADPEGNELCLHS
ncbi:VOC family protein [Catenulispora pinisilvae]|uniref:VOC family protein n=1 Tax=Catenulispora pinisilvae TaxID=2705253 RepID=UPI00189212E0|nr:VOC family protein [Catenulispora pinisilvae]